MLFLGPAGSEAKHSALVGQAANEGVQFEELVKRAVRLSKRKATLWAREPCKIKD